MLINSLNNQHLNIFLFDCFIYVYSAYFSFIRFWVCWIFCQKKPGLIQGHLQNILYLSRPKLSLTKIKLILFFYCPLITLSCKSICKKCFPLHNKITLIWIVKTQSLFVNGCQRGDGTLVQSIQKPLHLLITILTGISNFPFTRGDSRCFESITVV